VGRLRSGEARRALGTTFSSSRRLAACPVVLAFGDELLVLPDDEYEWISPGGRDLAAVYLLSRAETALLKELQRLADAAKRVQGPT
jgi:hypothetical protein